MKWMNSQSQACLMSRGEGEAIRLRRARRADAHRCDPFMSHTHSLPCATLVAWRTEWMITLGCNRKLFRSRPSCGEGAILCGRAVRLSGSILTAPSALDSIHASNQAFCCRAAVGLLSGFAVVLSGFCCRAVRPLSGCCQVLLSCCQVGAQVRRPEGRLGCIAITVANRRPTRPSMRPTRQEASRVSAEGYSRPTCVPATTWRVEGHRRSWPVTRLKLLEVFNE